MKRSTPISPIKYAETYENNVLENGDAVCNIRESVNVKVNVGNAISATRTSEKLNSLFDLS